MKIAKLFPDEYNEKTYAKHFKRIVYAKQQIQKGYEELFDIMEEMEVEYTRQFPKMEQHQLYCDAGFVKPSNPVPDNNEDKQK